MDLKRWKEIVSSPRFWQMFVILILQLLNHYGTFDEFTLNAISVFIAGVAAIGTVDRMSEKIGNK